MKMPSESQRKSLEQELQQYRQHLAGATSYLASRGITPQTAEKFGLGFDESQQKLVIPYTTPAGLWHLKYRCIQPHDCKEIHGGKYSYTQGAAQHLYRAEVLKDARYCVLVEGELDAITAEQCGITAVSYPGVSTWQKAWRFAFESLDELVVVADGDEAGRKAAATVSAQLRDAIPGDVKVVDMGDGLDVNSYYVQHGETALLERLGWL